MVRFVRRPNIFQRVAKFALRAAVVVVVAWGVGLYFFAHNLPKMVDDTQTHTDAIVVLTGGRGRLETALDLLSKGFAGKLFVSGVYRGVDVAKLLELTQRAPKELSCCIGIGEAENTIANASETRDWAVKNGVHSIRLVTSAYHMPRALLEFNYAMAGFAIIPHPVFNEHVKLKKWWLWPGTASLVASEYNKFLVAWVRVTILSSFARARAAI